MQFLFLVLLAICSLAIGGNVIVLDNTNFEHDKNQNQRQVRAPLQLDRCESSSAFAWQKLREKWPFVPMLGGKEHEYAVELKGILSCLRERALPIISAPLNVFVVRHAFRLQSAASCVRHNQVSKPKACWRCLSLALAWKKTANPVDNGREDRQYHWLYWKIG